MKIFTFTKINNKTQKYRVGMVLLGDHDEIYHYSCSTINANKFESTILTIKRGLLFIDNVKPLYGKDSIEIYSNLSSYEDTLNLDHKINCDEYIQKFKKKRNQSVNISFRKYQTKDEQFMNFAQTLVNVEERNEYAQLLSKLKINERK